MGMTGIPCEPLPGRPSQHIPVDVIDDGGYMGPESENEETKGEAIDEEDVEPEFRGHRYISCIPEGNKRIWGNRWMSSV